MTTTCDSRRRDALACDVFPAVSRFFWKFGPPNRADDMAQDAMLVILRIAHRFDPTQPGTAKSWAFGVCRNVLMKRQRKAPVPFSVVEGEDGDPVDPSDHRDAGDDGAMPPGELVRLSGLLHSLPEDDRDLIHLRFHVGLSPVEIAARLLLTPGQVRTRLYRAVRRLREGAVS